MKLGVLGLASLLLLTGCSSSLSLEEQERLIRYESCLASELELWKVVARDTPASSMNEFWMEKRKAKQLLSDSFVEYCSSYRP